MTYACNQLQVPASSVHLGSYLAQSKVKNKQQAYSLFMQCCIPSSETQDSAREASGLTPCVYGN